MYISLQVRGVSFSIRLGRSCSACFGAATNGGSRGIKQNARPPTNTIKRKQRRRSELQSVALRLVHVNRRTLNLFEWCLRRCLCRENWTLNSKQLRLFRLPRSGVRVDGRSGASHAAPAGWLVAVDSAWSIPSGGPALRIRMGRKSPSLFIL